ncbi:MAG: DNA polymerase III subunit chi [Rhodoblastus sp.]|nr:MAG: DNA polymerase III subunit chi [Rhodoblastus sp.]
MSGAKEVWFYHLERRTLEQTLPMLLERTLDRDWTAVVEASSEERVRALDAFLWTYAEDSFLPHGALGDGDPHEHPILLMTGPANPAGASVRFCVDGADPLPALQAATTPYERIVVIFDGADEDALARARAQWKAVKEAGVAISYWRQTPEGRWEKKA